MRILEADIAWIGLVSCLLLCVGAKQADAATRTWVGPDGGDWSNSANWNPAGPIDPTDDLIFPAAAPATSVNGVSPWLEVNSITFQAAHSVTGNAIRLYGGLTLDPSITVIIAPTLVAWGPQTWTIGTSATLTAGNLSLVGATPLTISTDTSASMSTPSLTGDGEMKKAGAGTLDLTGPSPSYAGAMTIDAGTVIVRASTGLGDTDGTVAHGTTVNAGGLLDVQDTASLIEALFLNGSGNLVLTMTAPATVVLTQPVTLTTRSAISAVNVAGQTIQFGASILGPGALDLRDQTTARLTASGSTFSAVYFSGLATGTLQAAASDTVPIGLAVDLPSTATLQLGGVSATLSSLTGTGAVSANGFLTVANATAQVFDGTITGTGRLIKTGVGELVLGGANAITSETQVLQGRLRVTNPGALSAGPGGARVKGNATLVLDNVSPTVSSVILERTTPGEIPTLEVVGPTPVTLTGYLQMNAGSVVHGSSGATLTLASSLTVLTDGLIDNIALHLTQPFTHIDGLLTIGPGATLHTDSDNAFDISNPIAIAATGTLALHGRATTLWGITGAGTLDLGTNAAVTMRNSVACVFSGAIVGSGTITKIADGDWTLSGPTTFTGGVIVSGGRLIVSHAQTLATQAITVSFGAGLIYTVPANPTGPISLDGNGPNNSSQALYAQGGNVTLAGPVTFGSPVADAVRVDAPYTLTFPSAIATTFLTAKGNGTVTLGASGNALGNLIIGLSAPGGGTVRAGVAGALPATCAITVGAGATYDLNNFNQTLTTQISGTGRMALGSATLTWQSTGPLSFNGSFSGTGAVVATASQVLLKGTHTLTGSVTVNGELQFDGTLPAPVVVNDGNVFLAANTVLGPLTTHGQKQVIIATPQAPGGVTLGGLTLSSGTRVVTSMPPNAVPLTVNGPVSIDGAVFLLSFYGGPTATRGAALTVIDNDGADPIAGVFANYPEGALIQGLQGFYALSYVGGTGNDLTVTLPFVNYSLAEGATGPFFDTELLLANPNDTAVTVDVELLPEGGSPKTLPYTLAPRSRTTILVDDIPGFENAAFSTVVTPTTDVPVLVERTMRWDSTGYGAHTEKAAEGPNYLWAFAEGSEGWFHTFLLLQNPKPFANKATVTYIPESGIPIQRTYDLAPSSRRTIIAADDPELVNQSFGILVSFSQPGMAERAMYFGSDPIWAGGHESAGTTEVSTTWFLAEGATGGIFDTFILVANPFLDPTDVTFTFLPESGEPVTLKRTIPPLARITINPAAENLAIPEGPLATKVESTLPVIAERSQYWSFDGGEWIEAHNSLGVTAAVKKWGLAEGRAGGPENYQTYILLANPGTTPAAVTLQFLGDGLTPAPATQTVMVPAERRLTVRVDPTGLPGSAATTFGTIVISDQPIVVERAMYWDANGQTWAAGTNATASKLP